MAIWEPVSSTNTRSWLANWRACSRQAARALSSCSRATSVFFFASSPGKLWRDCCWPYSPRCHVRLGTVGSALLASHRDGLLTALSSGPATALLSWQDGLGSLLAKRDRSLVVV